MRTPSTVVALVLAGACGGGASLPRAGDVVVAEAEVRIAPAAATSAAAYWELRHLGTVADTLVAVTSDAGEASIHRAATVGGLQRMEPLATLEVPAGRPTRFAPGGLHVMLEHFTRPIAVGDTLGITLHFARGDTVSVRAPVRAVGGDD